MRVLNLRLHHTRRLFAGPLLCNNVLVTLKDLLLSPAMVPLLTQIK
jgi:hypothetical protein